MLTLIARPGSGALTTAVLERVAKAARGEAGSARVLAPGEAVDLPCAAAPERAVVLEALAGAPVDAVVTRVENRRKRLLVADMDSTIVVGETLDELAEFAGVGEAVAAITRRSMNGEIDFAGALRERVALLSGLELAALERTWAGVRLTPGARTLVQTMRVNGATTALVSGGFTWFTSRVAALCGFDLHRANVLMDDGSVLSGKVSEPILDRAAKLDTLKNLAADRDLAFSDCLALGDGANDLAMIGAAGLGVAFHAKPVVAEAARVRIDHGDLRALLFIQGYAQEEFST